MTAQIDCMKVQAQGEMIYFDQINSTSNDGFDLKYSKQDCYKPLKISLILQFFLQNKIG